MIECDALHKATEISGEISAVARDGSFGTVWPSSVRGKRPASARQAVMGLMTC
jgi:hypothetical protein